MKIIIIRITHFARPGLRQHEVERYRRHGIDQEPAAQIVDGDEPRVDDHLAVVHVRRPEVDDHVRHEHEVNGEVDDDERIGLLERQEGGHVRSVDRDVHHQYQNEPVPCSLSRRIVQYDSARQA